MADIRIPFRPYFRETMRCGQKVMTCRSKKLGSPGDRFWTFGVGFELTHVFRVRLGYVVTDAFEQEGCESEEDLIQIWKDIHPYAGYDPNATVWAHCFRKIMS